MKNTALFDFKFVDRIKERELLSSFLRQSDQGNILWINGDSGSGKTYFVQKNILDCDHLDYKKVYVSKIGEATSSPYLTQFIKILGEVSNISFFEFLRANYTSIIDIVKKVTTKVLQSSSVNDFGLLESGFDLSKNFLTAKNEQHNLTRVIDCYLKYISQKTKALIILDNFTMCDEESLKVFSVLLHEHQTDKDIKFIVVTTNELLQKREDILTLLSEKVNVLRITIHAFKDYKYFADILGDIYDLGKCGIDYIIQLYEVCNGYPQKLKTFLMNLYSQEGIDYESEKAIFISDKLKQLLLREMINFDFDALRPSEKYVLRLIVEWGIQIDLTVLKKLSEYIANIDISLTEFAGNVFMQSIVELENMGVIEKIYELNACYVKIKHDSIYLAISEILQENPIKVRFIHYNMLQFINKDKTVFSKSDADFLIAYHSYMSKSENWISINEMYGLDLYERKQYLKAQKVFDRIAEYMDSLSFQSKITISLNSYNTGEYEKSDSILDLIQPETLDISELFLLYTARCRVAMMQLNYEIAINSINKLLSGDYSLTAEQHIEALYLKQVALCLTPDGYQASRKLFNDIVKQFKCDDGKEWMARVYRTAMDYYQGDISINYLSQSLEISQALHDDEASAKAIHNLGFEYFRCGDLKAAENCFQKSLSILQNIKQFETSYGYNNIAVIYMLQEDYVKALEILSEAFFWNKSEYATLTIKANKMLCFHYLRRSQERDRLREELTHFIDNIPFVDDKIYKKILTNFAIISIDCGENECAEKLLCRCQPHLKTELSQSSARVRKLLKTLGQKYEVERPEKYSAYYYDIPFEPWLLTFGNE